MSDVEFRSTIGYNTFLDEEESMWSAPWDFPDDVTLLMCLVTDFWDDQEHPPVYNGEEFFPVAQAATQYPHMNLWGLYTPPTDDVYTVGISWPTSHKHWSVQFAAFSGVRNGGIGPVTQIERPNGEYWSGAQASKAGDLVAFWGALRVEENPDLVWDSPGVLRFSALNDMDGDVEMDSSMATYPGLYSTPVGVTSQGENKHTHLMLHNLEQKSGGSKMILAM